MGEEEKEKGFNVTDKRFTKNSQDEEEEKEEKERGFKITDRRFGETKSPEEEKEEGTREEEEKGGKQSTTSTKDSSSFPELNFSTFLLSLTTSVMLHFGDIPDPITKKKVRNLPAAKETIDILDILKEKTKGNLTQEEERLIDDLLYNLHMRYVKERG